MKKALLIATILVANPAFADQNINTGAGNVINDNSGAGSGSDVNDSYDPNISAKGGNAKSNASSNSSSKSDASVRNTDVNKQGQKQSQSQQSKSSVRSSGDSANNYNAPRNPVSTAFSAPLTASDDTCMGSSSAGGQGVGFGLSLGTTWHDKDCVRRKDARELYNMGHKKAALALLSQSEEVRAALEAAGDDYPGRDVHEANDNTPSRHVEAEKSNDDVVYEYPKGVRKGW